MDLENFQSKHGNYIYQSQHEYTLSGHITWPHASSTEPTPRGLCNPVYTTDSFCLRHEARLQRGLARPLVRLSSHTELLRVVVRRGQVCEQGRCSGNEMDRRWFNVCSSIIHLGLTEGFESSCPHKSDSTTHNLPNNSSSYLAHFQVTLCSFLRSFASTNYLSPRTLNIMRQTH